MSGIYSLFQQSHEVLKLLGLDWDLTSLFFLEELSAAIHKNAVISPSPQPTFKITPEIKHQIYNQKFTTSNLISITFICAPAEYFNDVIKTCFSKNSIKLDKIRVNTKTLYLCISPRKLIQY